jgi:carboxyl-terminal processing protease
MRERGKGFWAGMVAGVLLTVTVGALGQAQPVSDEMRKLLRKFADAYHAVKQNFAGEASDGMLIDGCLSGMLRGADPHSGYLGSAEFKEMLGGGGPRGGLGMELAAAPNGVRVVAPIEGTAADRAGILPGDVVTRVDGAELGGLGLADAIKLLRGEPGTAVRLRLLRVGAPEPLEMTLNREIVRVQEVRSRLIEPGVGYLRVSQFRETTPDALARALTSVQGQNGAPLKGLVLDLRNNPGGLLHSGLAVAAAFLRDDQMVLAMQGRGKDANRQYFAKPADFNNFSTTDFRSRIPANLRSAPLVVLVNRGSAAASELVAAALQDHGRAVVAGEKTYGLGSVQTILPMGDGSALKVTTSYWHAPKGRMLHGQGVTPDVVLEPAVLAPPPPMPLGAVDDPALRRAAQILEKR